MTDTLLLTVRPADETAALLDSEARQFLAELHQRFDETRRRLLEQRTHGRALGFAPEMGESGWKVADCPHDLERRRVEITGPAEAKMMINALNSGADAFMADLEDALSPTWANVLEGHRCLGLAVRGDLSYRSPEGKDYVLAPKTAKLMVRPRGWHLEEAHAVVDGRPMSASLFDFGLFAYHNAVEIVRRGETPAFYLPKMESSLEARLWAQVFAWTERRLTLREGTFRATVLVETFPAAFQMDAILFELRDYAAGLNAGRWDYLFSMIKTLHKTDGITFPDRASLTMDLPFMRSYGELLVETCHARGAHAMGGMAAFVPSRKDAAANARAFEKVRADKEREVAQGFDGTWVAHPDLVPVAMEVFEKTLQGKPNQKDRPLTGRAPRAEDLFPRGLEHAAATEEGARQNVSVSLQYLKSWLEGRGAVAIDNLMEDAATAEISRMQLWHWIRRGTPMGGRAFGADRFREILREERGRLEGPGASYEDAAELLDALVTSPDAPAFLTTEAYGRLIRNEEPMTKGA